MDKILAKSMTAKSPEGGVISNWQTGDILIGRLSAVS